MKAYIRICWLFDLNSLVNTIVLFTRSLEFPPAVPLCESLFEAVIIKFPRRFRIHISFCPGTHSLRCFIIRKQTVPIFLRRLTHTSYILYVPCTSHTSQSISDNLAQRELACPDAIKANSAFVQAVGVDCIWGLGSGDAHVCESLAKTKPHLACLCEPAKTKASSSWCRSHRNNKEVRA